MSWIIGKDRLAAMPDSALAYRLLIFTLLSVDWKKKNHPDLHRLDDVFDEMNLELNRRASDETFN